MQVLNIEEIDQTNGGNWGSVSYGAGAIAAGAAAFASFPGTWAVPFAGGAAVFTATVMTGVSLTAGYFASM